MGATVSEASKAPHVAYIQTPAESLKNHGQAKVPAHKEFIPSKQDISETDMCHEDKVDHRNGADGCFGGWSEKAIRELGNR